MNRGMAAPDPHEPKVPMSIMIQSHLSANLKKEKNE